MAGEICDMKAIMAVADRHGIVVLEDCAQCNGGEFRGRQVGTIRQIGLFSFQWNKNATAGEGGLLVTNDPKPYERCVAAHDLGIPWVNGAPCETGPHAITRGSGRHMSEELRKTGLSPHLQAMELQTIRILFGHGWLPFCSMSLPMCSCGSCVFRLVQKIDRGLRRHISPSHRRLLV